MGMRIEKSCDECEWNIGSLLSEAWCAKHDIDRLPFCGCGDWRPNLLPAPESTAKDDGRTDT